MFHQEYEKIVQFASEGRLAEELQTARSEYVERTGEMFESDDNFERRIAAFLEWYALDRPLSFAPQMTPAKLYIEHVGSELTTQQINEIRELTRTRLSLFEFKKLKAEKLRVVDLLAKEKVEVFERRQMFGIESGDILQARLVPAGEKLVFSDSIEVHPRAVRRVILKAAKLFCKNPPAGNGDGRLDMVHRVARLSNRSARYKHVDPREIFRELV